MQVIKKAAILGGGSWATALAIKMALRYQVANIYLRDEAIIHEINNNNSNNSYLKDILLPVNLKAYRIEDFEGEEDLIVMAPASCALLEYLNIIKPKLRKSSIILIASKGFDYQNNSLFVTSFQKIVDNKVGVLSGPNFALEVAMNYPTATAIAFDEDADAKFVADSISTRNFVAMPFNSVIALQVAGFMKNIVAIACGMLDGMDYGANTKVWLIVKSFDEISLLTKFFGYNEIIDLVNVGIIGDMILTCYSLMSRNTKFGFGLASAKDYNEYLNSIDYLVEGAGCAKFLSKLALDNNIKLPIVSSLAKILDNPDDMQEIIKKLFVQ